MPQHLSLSDALEKIEQTTVYSFIYDARKINLAATLTHSIEADHIYAALEQLFQNHPIAFTIITNQIILSPREDILNLYENASFQVKGIVIDANHEPVPGVNVHEKGTSNGTITDIEGRFILHLTQQTTVLFSFIGYLSKEIPIRGDSSLTIQMTEDLHQIDEIVVTALGLEKKEASLSYASRLIHGDELVRVKDVNMINTLSGKMPGVQINRTSSGLGGSARVIIRGSRSVSGNNQPLYVIDGVPILNSASEQAYSTIGGTADAGNRDSGDGISNLNPDDIESINVLKGSYASALYGGQAANGVILIKTKKGKSGIRRINFSSTLTFDKAISLPAFQNEYGPIEGSTSSWGNKTVHKNPDHLNDFFQTGVMAINTISLTSGNQTIQNYFSYANTTGKGSIQHHKLNKHNLNLRETASFLNDKLFLDGNINLILQTVEGKPSVGGFYMNPLQGRYTFPPGMDIKPYREKFDIFS